MPIGLKNLGSTCFINTAVYLLFLLDIKDIKSQNPVVYELVKLAKIEAKVVKPVTLLTAIYDSYPDITPHLQGDSSEILARLMQQLCDATNKAKGPYGCQIDMPDIDYFILEARKAYLSGMDSSFERKIRVEELQITKCECGFESKTLNFCNGLYLDIAGGKSVYNDDQEKIGFLLIVPQVGVFKIVVNLDYLHASTIEEQLYNACDEQLYKARIPMQYFYLTFYSMEFDCLGLEAIIRKIQRYYEIIRNESCGDCESDDLADHEASQEYLYELEEPCPSKQQVLAESNLQEMNRQLLSEFGVDYTQISESIDCNVNCNDVEHLIIVTATQDKGEKARKYYPRMMTLKIADYEPISLAVPFPTNEDLQKMKTSTPTAFQALVYCNLVLPASALFQPKARQVLLDQKELKNWQITFNNENEGPTISVTGRALKIQCAKHYNDIDVRCALHKAQPLPFDQRVTITDCLNQYLEPQAVAGWRCPACKQELEVNKSIRLNSTSEYLVLNLKRFKTTYDQFGNQTSEKNNVHVAFGQTLRLLSNNYTLMGFSCHLGILDGGHYVACVRDGERWFECNDDTVHEINIQHCEKLKSLAQCLVFAKQ